MLLAEELLSFAIPFMTMCVGSANGMLWGKKLIIYSM